MGRWWEPSSIGLRTTGASGKQADVRQLSFDDGVKVFRRKVQLIRGIEKPFCFLANILGNVRRYGI
jgi:hypothetical protein